MNIIHYESKLGPRVSFPGEIVNASKFETVCGKVLWCDDKGDVYLFGSRRTFDHKECEWTWLKHPIQFTDSTWPAGQKGVYLGRLITQ